MKNITSCLTVLGAVTSCLMAMADTVAWWHLNEGANGVRPERDTAIILNSVDPSKLALKAGVHSAGKNYLGDAAYLPVYTNAFPSCATCRDPNGGGTAGDRIGMYFNPEAGDGASGAGSVIYMDIPSELQLTNPTVELFVKADYTSIANHWKNLICAIDSSGRESWSIHITAAGSIQYRYSYTADNQKSTSQTMTYDCQKVLDGEWHRIAFTHTSGSSPQVTLWCDSGSKVFTAAHAIENWPDSKLEIGSFCSSNYGRWRGWIDEIRISDTNLSTAELLQPEVKTEFQPKPQACDSNTVFYAAFDTEVSVCEDSFFATVGTPMLVNSAPADQAYPARMAISGSGTNPTFKSEGLANSQLHVGIYGTNTASNAGYWDFTTANGLSAMIDLDDISSDGTRHLLTSGNMTFELFIRSDKSTHESMSYLLCQHTAGGGGSLWFALKDDGAIQMSILSEESGSVIGTKSIGSTCFDGNWHHLALVLDRDNRTATTYFDYKQVLQTTDIAIDTQVDTKSYSKYLQIFGGYGHSHARQLDGQVDEVRLTARALAPNEFLRMGAAGPDMEQTATRALISFEGDLKVGPRPCDIPEGSLNAGSLAYDTDDVPGYRIVDGLGEVISETNRSSASFLSGGQLVFARNYYTDSTNMQAQTMEFFIRAERDTATAWTSLVRIHSTANAGDGVVYAVRYGDNDGSVNVRIDTEASGDGYFNQGMNFSGSNLDDGRWHHLAFTFSPDYEANKTLMKFYKDYSYVGEKNYNGLLRTVDSGKISTTSLSVGSTAFRGRIDEVRISQGVLSVNDMMHAVRRPRGMSILFR